jgi:phosphatidylinositol alpha 1,6-mannosyltransferase
MTTSAPRVALFADSYHEANGVARTAQALEAYAARHDKPLLLVHAGRADQLIEAGSVVRAEIRRSTRTSFGLDHDLTFDLAMWRHVGRVAELLRQFRPDVLHFTGPSDIGQLGAYLGHRLSIPMVGSWHTNLHEYASRRLLKRLTWTREKTRMQLRLWIERHALRATLLFYNMPRVILAPNEEWLHLLERRTGKPTFLMSRGIDTVLFTPDKRARSDAAVNIGYVGRLSPEKNVRVLAAVEEALIADGRADFRFTIVGDGSERDWLGSHLKHARFTGVLRGEALATAYADMDLFVFPSETETVGNVVLEAMASAVPVIAMERGGPKFIAGAGRSAVIARDIREFVDAARALVRDPARRQAMGAAARMHARERSWDRVFETVYRAYAVAASLDERRKRAAADDPMVGVGVVEKQTSA